MAWSPGVDLIFSHAITPRYTLISELRYVYTAIPAALGGSGQNYVDAADVDMGMRIGLTNMVSIIPEVGLFDFVGRLANRCSYGVAAPYDSVLAFRF